MFQFASLQNRNSRRHKHTNVITKRQPRRTAKVIFQENARESLRDAKLQLEVNVVIAVS
jgi:hypothetical protein